MSAQTRPTKTSAAPKSLKRCRHTSPAVTINRQMTPPLCSSSRACAALGLGLASVLSWGVAEIPQIITTYRQKSTEGLSIAFLFTWILGDLFNLAGCWLEPATLPTQFYMALMYTATTVLLTGLTLYYRHVYKWLKNRKGVGASEERETMTKREKDKRDGVLVKSGAQDDNLVIPSSPISVTAPLVPARTASGNFYLISARSLSSSPNPSPFLARVRDSALSNPRSREEHSWLREPLLVDHTLSQSTPLVKTKSMCSVVMSSVLFIGGLGLRRSSQGKRLEKSTSTKVILVGRKILQQNMSVPSSTREGGSSGIGTAFGWAMAIVYMGGRLPQICLNIRRGTVEGLSPLMFCFALVGNATYVASILVSSMEWSKISPNLPWLVDAAGCVLLDSFILIQFIYFRWHSIKSAGTPNEDD